MLRAAGLVVRNCVPSGLVPRVVATRTQIARRSSAKVADAEKSIRIVVGEERPADEVHALALRYLRRMAWRAETRWHPEWVNHQPVDGIEHLREALALGRGCILSFAHHADWEGTFPSIARHGITVDALGSSDMFVRRPQLWLRAQKAVVESAPGSTVIDVGGGSPVVRELLGRGSAVAIAMDVPGHTPMQFLGHELMLSSGGTRIAMDHDVPVVVITSRNETDTDLGSPRVTLSEVLRPASFGSAQELLQEIARQHEAAMLAWPEAVDRPKNLLDLTRVRQSTEYRPH